MVFDDVNHDGEVPMGNKVGSPITICYSVKGGVGLVVGGRWMGSGGRHSALWV